jgi:hypothetical protein
MDLRRGYAYHPAKSFFLNEPVRRIGLDHPVNSMSKTQAKRRSFLRMNLCGG